MWDPGSLITSYDPSLFLNPKPSLEICFVRYNLSFLVQLFIELLLCDTHFICLISKPHNNLTKLGINTPILQMKKIMLAEGRWPCLGSQVKHCWSGVYHESLTLNHAASQGQQLGMSFPTLLLLNARDFSHPKKYHCSIKVLTGEKEVHYFNKVVMTLWIQKLLLCLVLWRATGQYSPWFGVKIAFH